MKKEERSFQAQLQMSNTLRLEKLTLLAGTDIVKFPFRTIIVLHIALHSCVIEWMFHSVLVLVVLVA